MKKVFIIFLLPVFLFGIIGWQWMFFLKLYSHEKQEWNRGDEKGNQEIVVVSKAHSSETFFVNDHELMHKGKLYDVKYKEKKGEAIVCYCERDGAEENLLSSFDLKTKDSFGNSFSANSKTQKIVKLSIFENAVKFLSLTPIQQSQNLISYLEPPFRLSSVSESFFDLRSHSR